MEHQFFIRQQNLKLCRGLVAASEAAAAKADARQEKFLKLLAEEVANEPAVQKELRRLMPSGTLTRVARGDVREIPAEHHARLTALGYIVDLSGRLRMTTPGRRRIAAESRQVDSPRHESRSVDSGAGG